MFYLKQMKSYQPDFLYPNYCSIISNVLLQVVLVLRVLAFLWSHIFIIFGPCISESVKSLSSINCEFITSPYRFSSGVFLHSGALFQLRELYLFLGSFFHFHLLWNSSTGKQQAWCSRRVLEGCTALFKTLCGQYLSEVSPIFVFPQEFQGRFPIPQVMMIEGVNYRIAREENRGGVHSTPVCSPKDNELMRCKHVERSLVLPRTHKMPTLGFAAGQQQLPAGDLAPAGLCALEGCVKNHQRIYGPCINGGQEAVH